MIATACRDEALRLWDAVTGDSIGVPIRHEAPVTAVRFSPDGTKIATASRADLPCLWDATTGLPIGGKTPGGPGTPVVAIAFHPEGTLLAAAGEDGRVRFHEPETGRRLDATLPHEATVPALAFSPDGRALLSGCLDGRARLWDVAGWSLIAEFPHRAAVGCVGFSPPGRSVATGCQDGTARLWDVGTGKPIGEPLAHRAAGRLPGVQPRRIDRRDGEPGRDRPALGCRDRPADRPPPGASRRGECPGLRPRWSEAGDGVLRRHGAILADPGAPRRERGADRLLDPRRDRARVRRGGRAPSHGPTGRLGASPPPPGSGRTARQVTRGRRARHGPRSREES